MASNWAELKETKTNVTIPQLFGVNKLENKKFKDQYKSLQKQILNTLKSSIPSKEELIPIINDIMSDNV